MGKILFFTECRAISFPYVSSLFFFSVLVPQYNAADPKARKVHPNNIAPPVLDNGPLSISKNNPAQIDVKPEDTRMIPASGAKRFWTR